MKSCQSPGLAPFNIGWRASLGLDALQGIKLGADLVVFDLQLDHARRKIHLQHFGHGFRKLRHLCRIGLSRRILNRWGFLRVARGTAIERLRRFFSQRGRYDHKVVILKLRNQRARLGNRTRTGGGHLVFSRGLGRFGWQGGPADSAV